MFKRLVLVLTMLLLVASPALAQEGVLITPKHSDPHWVAAYWNNTYFSGAPVLQQSEAAINYDWQAGSPHPAVGAVVALHPGDARQLSLYRHSGRRYARLAGWRTDH